MHDANTCTALMVGIEGLLTASKTTEKKYADSGYIFQHLILFPSLVIFFSDNSRYIVLRSKNPAEPITSQFYFINHI